jgi:hypothetical protein
VPGSGVLDIYRRSRPEFAPRRGWRAQPRVSTLGTDHVGSQVWVTLLSHYFGYTLSQHLGDSFRFAPRGQLSAHIVAPAKNFFLAFYALPFPEHDREFRDLFFASNDQSIFISNLLPLL